VCHLAWNIFHSYDQLVWSLQNQLQELTAKKQSGDLARYIEGEIIPEGPFPLPSLVPSLENINHYDGLCFELNLEMYLLQTRLEKLENDVQARERTAEQTRNIPHSGMLDHFLAILKAALDPIHSLSNQMHLTRSLFCSSNLVSFKVV
jgi:hypothetical protein